MISQNREAGRIDAGEIRHQPIAAHHRLFIYVTILCVTPFLLIAATLAWIGSSTYRRHIQYVSLLAIGYGARLQNANCDVLIDGDSTAMVGIQPAIIEQQTGLKTCNIAETAGVKAVNGNMVLDAYLKHNLRPRYVVFSFAPENLTQPREWDTVSLFEGVYFRLQYKPDAAFFVYAIQNPDNVITSAELGFRNGVKWIFSKPLPPEVASVRDASHGYLVDGGEPLATCPLTLILREPDASWLASLRQKYGSNGTRVLIDVAPEPACALDRDFYQPRLLHGVTDNAWWMLPLGDFTDSGRLHTTDAGSAKISMAIASQLKSLSQENR